MPVRKIGRNARTGRFTCVTAPNERPASVVETYVVYRKTVGRLDRVRSFRHLMDDIQRGPGSKAGRDL